MLSAFTRWTLQSAAFQPGISKKDLASAARGHVLAEGQLTMVDAGNPEGERDGN